jgi:hypothetical protein
MNQSKKSVAHALSSYLFPTGTWIYSQLVHSQRFRPLVITNRTENPAAFTFSPVYA